MENEEMPTQGTENIGGIPTQGPTNLNGIPTQYEGKTTENGYSSPKNNSSNEKGNIAIGNSGEKYTICQKINSSGEADIYLCEKKNQQIEEKYVIKLYSDRRKIDFGKRKKIIDFLSTEHKYVIKLIDYGEYNGRIFDIYPYYKAGNISKIMQIGDEEARKKYLKSIIIPQINEGLSEIHSKNIIHRDIKPENIFIEDSFSKIVIGDFGISSIIDEKEESKMTSSDTRTPGYTAPETYSGLIGNWVDYYSMGIVVLQILRGRNVFSDLTTAEIFAATMERKIPFLNNNPSGQEKIDILILGLTMYDYKKRWGYEEIKKWLNGEFKNSEIYFDRPKEKNNTTNNKSLNNFSRPVRLNGIMSLDLKELGIALTKDWEKSKASLYHGKITPILENEGQLDLADYIYELINNTNNYLTFDKQKNDKKDLGLFKTIYLFNPEIDKIYWKNKSYDELTDLINDLIEDKSIGDLLLNGNISWYLKKRKQYVRSISQEQINQIEDKEKQMREYAVKGDYLKADEILYRFYMMFQKKEDISKNLVEIVDDLVLRLENYGNNIYKQLNSILLDPTLRAMVWAIGKEGIFEVYDKMNKDNKFYNATEQLKILEVLTSRKQIVRKLALKYGKKSNISWLKEHLNLYYYQNDYELIDLKNKISNIDLDVGKNDITMLTNNLNRAEMLYNEFSRKNLSRMLENINKEVIGNNTELQKKIIPLVSDAIFISYYDGIYTDPIGFIKLVEEKPYISIPEPYKVKEKKRNESGITSDISVGHEKTHTNTPKPLSGGKIVLIIFVIIVCSAYYDDYKYTKSINEYNNQIETIEKEGNTYNAPKISSIKYNATNLENSDISGYNEINDNIEGQEKKTYTYCAPESGTYAFYFEKDSKLRIEFCVYDKKGNAVEYLSDYISGLHGKIVNVELEKNVQYSITINNKSKSNSGKYTMYICPPREIADVTDYSVINDNIQYVKQKIIYKYTASTTGEYEFIKRNVTGNSIELEIVDENQENVQYYSSSSGSNTENAKLEKGKNYYIIVTENSSHGMSYDYERYGDLGSYTILIKKD